MNKLLELINSLNAATSQSVDYDSQLKAHDTLRSLLNTVNAFSEPKSVNYICTNYWDKMLGKNSIDVNYYVPSFMKYLPADVYIIKVITLSKRVIDDNLLFITHTGQVVNKADILNGLNAPNGLNSLNNHDSQDSLNGKRLPFAIYKYIRYESQANNLFANSVTSIYDTFVRNLKCVIDEYLHVTHASHALYATRSIHYTVINQLNHIISIYDKLLDRIEVCRHMNILLDKTEKHTIDVKYIIDINHLIDISEQIQLGKNPVDYLRQFIDISIKFSCIVDRSNYIIYYLNYLITPINCIIEDLTRIRHMLGMPIELIDNAKYIEQIKVN